jgi:hypothetical protein
MAKINLLPPDLGPSASILKFLGFAKKAAVVISIMFFVFGTLLVGYILFLRMQIQASVKRSDGLKSSITALSSTEQSVYLLKERVGKIKALLAKETQEKSLSGSGSILLNHPGINLTQVLTSQGKVSLSGNALVSGDLNNFFETILSDNNVTDINLASFVFNPKSGYIFSLDLTLK